MRDQSSNRGWRFALFLAFGWALVLGVTPVFAEEEGIGRSLEEKRKDLQEIKRRIAAEREHVRRDSRREKAVAADLLAIQKKVQEKRKEAARLQRQINRNQARVSQLTREIQSTQASVAQTKSLLARRLRAMYKQGRGGVTTVLFSANSLEQAAINLRYLQAVAQHDRDLIRSFQMAIATHQRKREELGQELGNLNSGRVALQVKQQEIAQDEAQKRVLLATVRSDKADSLKRLDELQRSSKALQGLIGQLQERMRTRQASAPTGAETVYLKGLHFAGAKGRLSWPTEGEVLASFGRQEHPRYRTFTVNKGIDIGAPLGNGIRAVFEGIVLFADWFRGYGRMAIIDHGQGYYTLYAHASELSVQAGDKVVPRQVIGKVGDTGSPEGPRLHFEIRQNGKPVDPLRWLAPNP